MIALSPSGCPAPTSPSLGTRLRGHDVVPPSFLRSLSSWKRGSRNPSPSPLWVPACAGTTWFHRRLSCEACPRGNGEQESIPLPPLGTRLRGHDVVPPSSFLRSLSSWKRGSRNPSPPIAQIRLANRPKSPCKPLTTQSPLLYHSVQSFPEQGARPWRTLGAVVPAWAVARYRRGHIPRLTWRDGQPLFARQVTASGLDKAISMV